jgi:uncharacterized SAM-binding protein YcdF (DUF218 family)
MKTMKRFLRLIVFCLFVSILWSGYVLKRISEVEKASTAVRKADVAIVLGAAVWGEDPSPGLRERLDRAIWLYQQQYVPVLLVSGGLGEGKEVDEATVMKKYLTEHGVPEEYVIMENKARSTYQNLQFSKEIMQQHSLQTALVVSHGYHLARAMEMAESLGMTVYPVGVQSHVLVEPYHKAREVLAYTKWRLSHYLPIER